MSSARSPHRAGSVLTRVGGVSDLTPTPDVLDKSEDDADREAQLLEMRLTLTEERNAGMVPSAGSGIPGAPAEW